MSDGALKVGDVYVAVSASIGDFVQSMQRVAKIVGDTAKKVKEFAKGIADVGMLFAGAMVGAVAAASQSNTRIRADLDKLKQYLYTLAADVGDAFAPFLHELSRTLGLVVGAFQRLSPEVKTAVAHFTVFMASVGMGAAGVSKLAGLVESVAKATSSLLAPALEGVSRAAKMLGAATQAAFPSLGEAVASMEGGITKALARVALSFGSVLLPIAAVAAAIAGIVLLAGTLYEAWHESGSGLKDSVLSIWQSIKDLGRQLMETLSGWFDMLKASVQKALLAILDGAAFMLRKLSGLMAPLARGLGLEGLAGLYEEMSKLTGEQLLKDLQTGASFLVDKVKDGAQVLVDGAKRVGRDVADGVSYGLAYSTKGLKRLASDTGLDTLPERLKAALGGVLGGPEGKVRKPFEAPDVSAVGKVTLKDLMDAGGIREFAQGGISSVMKARLDYLKEQARKLAEDTAAAMKEARRALTEKFAGAFGDLSTVISTFQQGMTAGGLGGGLAAVAGELLTKSQQFSTLVETINGLIGHVADWLGKLAAPFIPLVGALSTLVDAGLEALTPVLQSLTAFIQPLVPSIMVVGELFQALAPVIALIVQAATLVLNPLQLFAGPVLKGLFEALKFVSKVILTVVKDVAGVWNGILSAIQKVFLAIASIDVPVLGHVFGFLGNWADGLEGAKINTDALAESLMALNGLTWEAAQAKAEETAAVLANRVAVDNATKSLTNVPSVWKEALSRFEAQDAGGPGWGSGSGVPPAPATSSGGNSHPPPPGVGYGPATPTSPPTSSAPAVAIDTLNITASDVQEGMSALERKLDDMAFRMTGSRARTSRYARQGG